MTANIYVVIEKPANDEEFARVQDAIDLLTELDEAIGKCSTNAHEDCPEFRNAAYQLEKVLKGEWRY